MFLCCETCGLEYDPKLKDKNARGKYTQCAECGEEGETAVKYTGNKIFGHKCGSELQINADARLTQYINDTTKLKNKGSNLGNNINQVSKNKKLIKTQGACVKVADAVDYKNRGGI